MSGERQAVETLARLIEEASGNLVPEAHHPFLARTARERARAVGLGDTGSYVDALGRGALPDEWTSLLPLVTVNESSFFRTPQHFEALSREILPELLRNRSAVHTLHVWSAGCARGEEPGTLAMLLAGHDELADWRWRILATDLDEEALAAARRGAYGRRSVSAVPETLLERHFQECGGRWELSPELLGRIDYRVHNLIGPPPVEAGQAFDVIFLRNVLIYLSREAQQRVVATLARVLAADGSLFLGPSETLWQLSEAFAPVDLGDCFCYRHQSSADAAPRPTGTGGRTPVPRRAGSAGTSSPRRPELTASAPSAHSGSARQVPPPRPQPGPQTSGNAGQAAARVRQEWGTRERLRAACVAFLADDTATAERLVRETIAADPADPEAHLLEGFIHDLLGRAPAAVASYRAALYLDGRLFQCRLLLADALRRSGWGDRASQEYREVLALVKNGRARTARTLDGLPLATAEQATARGRALLAGTGA